MHAVRKRIAHALLGLGLGLTSTSRASAQDTDPPKDPATGATPPLSPAPATAPTAEERLRRVEAELDRLRQERSPSPPVPVPVPVPAPSPSPAPIVPDRPAIDLKFSGIIHADAVLLRQTSQEEVNHATNEPLNEERFVLRRARLRMLASKGFASSALMIDGNTTRAPVLRVMEAWVGATWASPDANAPPYLMATAGLQRIPFGHEVLQAARDRLFLERTNAARAMFASPFDLGLRVHGGYRFLRYSVAAMNGAPLNEAQFQGRDPNESRDLLFRIGIDTEVIPNVRVQAGVSGLTGKGFHQGAPPTKDVLVWRDDNENGIVENPEIHLLAGSPATPSSSFRRFALAADARVIVDLPVVGALTLQGELFRAKNMDRALVVSDPVAAGRDLRQSAVGVAVFQSVTRYAMFGIRHDRYDPDADASEQQGVQVVPVNRTFTTWTFTAAAIYSPGRLIAQYDINRNALGRATDGAPATLKDDTFTLRAEVSF